MRLHKGVRDRIMVQTHKTVGLFELTRSVDKDYDKDINRLCNYLLEPFDVPCTIYTQVLIPTVLKFQFFASHVIKALDLIVHEEMMTQEAQQALKTAIEESGAYEIEIEIIYESKIKVEGCN